MYSVQSSRYDPAPSWNAWGKGSLLDQVTRHCTCTVCNPPGMIQCHLGMLEEKGSLLDQVTRHCTCTVCNPPGMIQRHLGMLEGEGSPLDQVTGHWQCASLLAGSSAILECLIKGEGPLLDQVTGHCTLCNPPDRSQRHLGILEGKGSFLIRLIRWLNTVQCAILPVGSSAILECLREKDPSWSDDWTLYRVQSSW